LRTFLLTPYLDEGQQQYPVAITIAASANSGRRGTIDNCIWSRQPGTAVEAS
jgi:hypothetical protein